MRQVIKGLSCAVLVAACLVTASRPVEAANPLRVSVTYYEVQDVEVAEAVERINETYQGMPQPADGRESMQRSVARGLESWEVLQRAEPVFAHTFVASEGARIEETADAGGGALELTCELGDVGAIWADKISIKLDIRYDSQQIYQGSVVPPKIGEPRQVRMIGPIFARDGTATLSALYVQVNRVDD